jgi:hypothetical protein
MARFLAVETTGMYRLNFNAFDGDMMKLSFAEPVPFPFPLPLRNLRPRSDYGGGVPVSKEYTPTKMRISGRKKQLVDFSADETAIADDTSLQTQLISNAGYL